MSAQDMAQCAYNAGFRGDALVTAIAISLAEDGSSDPNAWCQNCIRGYVEDSRGYWQINVNVWTGFGNLFDGQTNANAAWVVSRQGTVWTDWSTYNDGAYLAHIGQAQALAAQVGGSAPSGAGSGSSGGQGSNEASGTLNPIPFLLVLGGLAVAAASSG